MDNKLTIEAREAIRSYLLRVIAIPGTFASIVLFVMGYLVHDVADSKAESAASKAYAEAIKDASGKLHDLTIETTGAKMNAELAKEDLEALHKDALVLVDRIEKNEQLSASINDQEAIADLVTDSLLKNPIFLAEVKQWPDGRFCIISNGKCPEGFERSEGFMKGISIFPDGNVNGYIQPSTPRLGDLFIQCHGACREYGKWTGELIVSTCCK